MLSSSGLGDIVAMRHHLDVLLICANLRVKTPHKKALLEKFVPTTALVDLPFLIKWWLQGKWPFEAGIKSTNCWCSPDGDGFRVRGLNYLHDGKKVPAGQPLAKLFAVDWFVDYKRMDDVCSRPAGTCQQYLLVNDLFRFLSSKITWHFCPGNKMWIKHLFCVRCQYTSAGCSPFLDNILLCPRGPCGCGNRLLELICSSDYKFQTNRIPCLVASYMATIIFETLVWSSSQEWPW